MTAQLRPAPCSTAAAKRFTVRCSVSVSSSRAVLRELMSRLRRFTTKWKYSQPASMTARARGTSGLFSRRRAAPAPPRSCLGRRAGRLGQRVRFGKSGNRADGLRHDPARRQNRGDGEDHLVDDGRRRPDGGGEGNEADRAFEKMALGGPEQRRAGRKAVLPKRRGGGGDGQQKREVDGDLLALGLRGKVDGDHRVECVAETPVGIGSHTAGQEGERDELVPGFRKPRQADNDSAEERRGGER